MTLEIVRVAANRWWPGVVSAAQLAAPVCGGSWVSRPAWLTAALDDRQQPRRSVGRRSLFAALRGGNEGMRVYLAL